MTSNRLLLKNHFKLGIFAPNCSGGTSMTKVPERWRSTWRNNLTLGKLLDDAGMDFILPIGRWLGYGGATNFNGSVLEPSVWAAALLASTRRISLISTVHTGVNNPVVVAKQLATMNQIGEGRVALNLVAGWNKPEYDALGLTLPDDHITRYAYAQEWLDVIRMLWAGRGPEDFNGRFFSLKQVQSEPTPMEGGIPLINAAGSEEGRDFAVRNADFLFMTSIDLDRSRQEIVDLKAKAAKTNKNLELINATHVVCRPTVSEAEDYVAHYAEAEADWEGVDSIISLMFTHAQSFPADVKEMIRGRFAMGHGSYPLVGTPEMVADGLCQVAETGFTGTALSFVNYVDEFPYFRDTVLPILEKRGVRLPNQA